MIDKKSIIEETYNTLSLIKEYNFGILVYNKPHFKHDLIQIITDINKINKLIKDGWRMYPGKYKFIMRAPEAVLCDLSELDTNPIKNITEVLILYKIIKSINILKFIKNNLLKLSYFKNLKIIDIRGKSLDLEIRIAGSDSRVKEIPIYLIKFLKRTNLWQKYNKQVKSLIKNREIVTKTKDISNSSLKTKRIYNKIVQVYKIFKGTEIPNKVTYNIWKQLPQCDVYVFVPMAGLKYCFGFIEDTERINKIMLWECHLNLDRTKELRFFIKNLKNKKIFIIDRSYSGNTIIYLKKKIKNKGGRPYGIAVFPKSKRSIKNSKYFYFLDKLIETRKVNFSNNWQERLFIKVVNQQI